MRIVFDFVGGLDKKYPVHSVTYFHYNPNEQSFVIDWTNKTVTLRGKTVQPNEGS